MQPERIKDILDYWRSCCAGKRPRIVFWSSHTVTAVLPSASIVGDSRTIVLVAATSEDLSSDNNDADGLNNLMTLHVHKDMSDALDAREIAREFVLREPRQ